MTPRALVACYRATLRPAQMTLVAPGMSGSQRGSLGCCTACSGDASKAVVSRLTKCSGIFVVGVGVEFTRHPIRSWLVYDAGM